MTKIVNFVPKIISHAQNAVYYLVLSNLFVCIVRKNIVNFAVWITNSAKTALKALTQSMVNVKKYAETHWDSKNVTMDKAFPLMDVKTTALKWTISLVKISRINHSAHILFQ